MGNFCFLSLAMQEQKDMLTKLKAGRMKNYKLHSLQQIIRLWSKYIDRGAIEVKESATLNEITMVT